MPKTFEPTIKAFEGDITKMDPAQAVKNIQGWMDTLEKADFRGSKIIHENLGKLKTHLEAEKLDGPAIMKLVNLLGEETSRAAGSAEGAKGEKIKHLGELLSESTTSKSKKK